MKKIVIFSVYLFTILLANAEELYYSVNIENETVGYIQTRYTEAEYQHKMAYVRETWSVFNVESSKYIIDEKTIYDHNSNKVQVYLMSYQKDLAWQQQQYFFSGNSVKVIADAKDPKAVSELPLRKELNIVTDYFSLLPFFAQCNEFPISVFAAEPKKINTSKASVPTNKITISPLGIRKIKILDEVHTSHAFHLVNEDSSKLTFWLSKDKTKILKIKQHQINSTIIELTDENIVDVVEKRDQSIGLPKVRPLPFNIGEMYRYVVRVDGEKVGSMEFFIRFDNSKRIYQITAVASFLESKISFTSTTEYSEDLKPISYELKEQNIKDDENIIVKCEFKKQGVKVYFHKNLNILERLVPLSGGYVFLDNNSYHHFAVFASQLPLLVNENVVVSIFHPRRLQTTKGLFTLIESKKDNYVYEFKTPFYELKMFISEKGQLYKYEQDSLVAELEKK